MGEISRATLAGTPRRARRLCPQESLLKIVHVCVVAEDHVIVVVVVVLGEGACGTKHNR